MHLFMLFRKHILLSVAAFLAAFTAWGQSYDFKLFDTNMGLPQNFVYSLAQDNQGYLWIGTGEGLVKYDGLKFKSFNVNDSLASDFVQDIYLASNGVLWIGHDNGMFSRITNDVVAKVVPASSSSAIRDICEDKQGNIWAVEQNSGLLRIGKDGTVVEMYDRQKFGRKLYYSVQTITDSELLVGTNEGLFKVFISGDAIASVEQIASIPECGINTIVKRRSYTTDFWIGTDSQGFYLYQSTNNGAKDLANNKLCLSFNIHTENITDIIEEYEGHLLVSTWGNGVIKMLFDPRSSSYTESFNFSETNGLSNNYVKDIMYDREGNYWFATYGGGVSSLITDYFIYYNLEEIGFKNNKVNSIIHFNKELWMGLENGMLKTDPFCFAAHEFYDQFQGIPKDVITGMYLDEAGVLWVGTSQSGLYKRKKEEVRFTRHHYANSLMGNQINDIEGSDGKLYIASIGGLYVLDFKGTKEVFHLTTERNLPHNSINFVFKDKDGSIWIGPKSSGICKIDIANLNIEVHRIDQTPVDVADMAQDSEGRLWLATRGKGVLMYSEDNLKSITVQNGLSKNFCHSIAADSHNRLWVAHHPGLSCIDLATMQVRTFGHNDKMGGDFQQIWKDKDNTLWFASSLGGVQYFPDRDKPNQTPPTINFTSIEINKEKQPLDKTIVLPYQIGKAYSYRFNFTGISFKNPLGVTYKYKLEEVGNESATEWVELGSNNFKDFEFLPPGEYLFKVLAYNADGVASPTPIEIRLEVLPPFWKRVWFYVLTLSVIGFVIAKIVKMREQQLIQQKNKLQNEVASQTITLRNQKAEIERKNRDITDSINYAKRIQASILPPISQLQGVFPESFIYFAPRDIVSGDFYWMFQSKEYFLVSIADCTGHGVPGAFMSMIGSTLLNDIAKAQPGLSPAQILESLDREIKVLLQKNSIDQTQDGMDISILEIHLATKRIRVASAKRPVFLYTSGELSVYKGTRRSIGEMSTDIDEESSEFVNIEYQLQKGDSIYMFSDGYSDQFGGPLGKKFMKVGVMNLLDQIRHKKMEEQFHLVKDNFMNWKGELDQVDDVIFMGIKL
jgi:ligand-binding sensor domain-containing protein/serine phosphatase RsbU (regulator of sigma subunit)